MAYHRRAAGRSKPQQWRARLRVAARDSVASERPRVAVNMQPYEFGDFRLCGAGGHRRTANDNRSRWAALADVAAVLSANNLATDKLQLSIQPLLVKTTDRVLLFDTGAGGNFGPGAGRLLTSLAAGGVEQQGVTDIFISHSHGDHIGGLVNAQGTLNFPSATIHLSDAEWKHFAADEKMAAVVAAIKPKVAAFAPGAQLFRRGPISPIAGPYAWALGCLVGAGKVRG